MFDDDYSSISTDEARKRVSNSVVKYKNGELHTISYEEEMYHIDNWLKTV